MLSILLGWRSLSRASPGRWSSSDEASSSSRRATSPRGFARWASPSSMPLVGVYNRMIDEPARGACAGPGAAPLPGGVLAVRPPPGILTFDFDGTAATATRRRSGCSCCPADGPPGPSARRAAGAVRRALAGWRRASRRSCRSHGSRRVRWQKSRFLDRGFPRCPAPRGADRGAAAVRAGRVREDHPHALARDREHDRRRRVPARVGPCTTRSRSARGPRGGLRDRPLRREHAPASSQRLRPRVRRRRPPAAAPPQPVRSAGRLAGRWRSSCARRPRRTGLGSRWRSTPREARSPSRPDGTLEQVLVNVLSNASRRRGPAARSPSASASRAGRAVLTVEDSGPGIPRGGRGAIFTPFFSTKENGRGSA